MVAGGLTRWGVRLSGTGRVRVYDGRTDVAPQLRAAYDRPRLSLSALAERTGVDSARRVDVSARVTPLPRLALVAFARHVFTDYDDLLAEAVATGGLVIGPLWPRPGAGHLREDAPRRVVPVDVDLVS